MNKIIKGVEVEYLHKLYHSSPAKIRKSLPNEFDFKTIMILGHNPGSADFLAHLCSEWHRMPTAATALLTINNPNESWKIKGNWDLEELILPREL